MPYTDPATPPVASPAPRSAYLEWDEEDPEDADDTLWEIFLTQARGTPPVLDNTRFTRIMRKLLLVDRNTRVSLHDCDVAFAAARGKSRRVDFEGFQHALMVLGQVAFPSLPPEQAYGALTDSLLYVWLSSKHRRTIFAHPPIRSAAPAATAAAAAAAAAEANAQWPQFHQSNEGWPSTAWPPPPPPPPWAYGSGVVPPPHFRPPPGLFSPAGLQRYMPPQTASPQVGDRRQRTVNFVVPMSPEMDAPLEDGEEEEEEEFDEFDDRVAGPSQRSTNAVLSPRPVYNASSSSRPMYRNGLQRSGDLDAPIRDGMRRLRQIVEDRDPSRLGPRQQMAIAQLTAGIEPRNLTPRRRGRW